MSRSRTTNVDYLYHIIFTVSHLSKDVNDRVEKVRVCGTYTNLGAAKAAAHRTLFEAGYEKEWFTEYDTKRADFITHGIKRRTGLAVQATAPDGTIFRVSIATTANVQGFRDDEDHKIHKPLYHVVQTNVNYGEDDSGEARDINVEGSFLVYEQAREFAAKVLLDPEAGVTKESFAEYDEAGPNEVDCGYGEDTVVHAVGQNGENFLVGILRGQDLAEEATRIRHHN